MPLNETAHALTWAQESKTHPQFIPPPPGKRIEDLEIVDVWRALGGGPLQGSRGRAFWRDGDGLSVSLNSGRGVWKDFVSGVGGGILALVMIALGCGKAEALAWLVDNCGVATGNEYAAADRREFARRRAAAKLIATQLIERRDEAFNAIREAKRRKLEEYHQLNSAAYAAEDIELSAQAEGIWSELQSLDAEGDRILQTTDAIALERLLSERRAA